MTRCLHTWSRSDPRWIGVVFAAVLLAGLLSMLSCSDAKRPDVRAERDDVFEQLSFEVDTSLLGDTVRLEGIEFRVPRGWKRVEPMILRAIRQAAGRDTSRHRLFPEAAHAHSNGSVFVASRFPNANRADVSFSSWAITVGEAYRVARAGMELKEAWLSLGGIEALQLYSGDQKTVHFKLLLNAGVPLSLDYTVPTSAWEGEVHGVESSLGSIRRLPATDEEVRE